MFICVTPNPAIDRTLVVPDFPNHPVSRTVQTVVAAGGKGINVARALRVFGVDAINCGLLGGYTGRYLEKLAQDDGLHSRWTWIKGEGETRTCVIVAEAATGQTWVVNESGPTVTAADWEQLTADLIAASGEGAVIAISGSLPPGSPVGVLAGVVNTLSRAGRRVCVDTSGTPLNEVMRLPAITIKINDDELRTAAGLDVRTPQEIANTIRQLQRTHDNRIVVTMGEQGAVLVDVEAAWWAKPPRLEIKSAVGSGDSFLAGLLAAEYVDHAVDVSLRQAAAAGAANALSVGGARFTLEEFQSVFEATTMIQLE